MSLEIRALRFAVPNELSRHRTSLMHELEVAVLAVSTGLTKDNWTGFEDGGAVGFALLAAALHVELLDVCAEFK